MRIEGYLAFKYSIRNLICAPKLRVYRLQQKKIVKTKKKKYDKTVEGSITSNLTTPFLCNGISSHASTSADPGTLLLTTSCSVTTQATRRMDKRGENQGHPLNESPTTKSHVVVKHYTSSDVPIPGAATGALLTYTCSLCMEYDTPGIERFVPPRLRGHRLARSSHRRRRPSAIC